MKRIFCALTLLTLALPSLALADDLSTSASADFGFITPTPTDPATPAPVPISVPDVKAPNLFDAIDRSRALLQARLTEMEKSKPTIVTSTNVVISIVISVWNKKTDTITLVDASKDKSKLTLKTPFPDAITITSSNGVNSQYAIPGNADEVVVGVIYPTFKDVTVKKKKPQFELHDKVYVPYNTAFYTPEALRKGSDYLSYLLKDAYDELRAAGVKSRAFPDKLLADIADPYLVKSIAIIEHADSQIYADDQSEKAVGRFLITLALNGEDAFDFSVSTAGARGLVQFIPSTYKSLATKRPELHLIQDFTAAMADHTNAVKAQMALLDENLALMPKDVRALFTTDRGRVAPFLAAAYNGGSTRVRASYADWGDAWLEYRMPQLDAVQAKADQMDARMKQLKKLLAKTGLAAKDKKAYTNELAKLQADRPAVHTEYWNIKNDSLHKETAQYVEKLNKVYTMLAAGYFATPNAADGGVAGGMIAAR